MNDLADINSSFSSGAGINVLNGNIDTLLVDLWGTIARSDNREPIRDLQEILGYKVQSIDHSDVRSVDPEFLDFCLTIDEKDPVRYAQIVGTYFGIEVTPEMVDRFVKVINVESQCSMLFIDATKALKILKARGYKLVLASNLWPFPVDCLFDEDHLGGLFPEQFRAYSFREKVAKPNSDFFVKTLVRAEAPAGNCLMIGDHLENDILPAREKGILTCLIDRTGKYRQDERVPADVIHAGSMMDLLEMLPDRTQLNKPLAVPGSLPSLDQSF